MGLRNSQRVGKAYGIKMLNCHRNAGTKTWLPADRLCIALPSCQSLPEKVVPYLPEDPASQQPLEKNTWLDDYDYYYY